jgi:hypothetical protein
MSLEIKNHTHTHRLQSSLTHQNKVTMRPYLHDAIRKITYTQITVIIDTSEQGYNAAISSWRDMQNHTHTHRSCSQVIDLAAHGHRTSSISVDGLENWFLAWNETTKLPEPAFLVCKSLPRVEEESIGKIMIIGHRLNSVGLFILKTMIIGHRMNSVEFCNPNFGLQEPKCDRKVVADFLSACSSWCQEVLGYLPRTQLRARGMSQEFFWHLC